MALQEAMFLHQFCSSPAEVNEVCNQLEKGGYNYEFAKQEELSTFIRSHRPLVKHAGIPKNDPKLGSLVQIIRDANGQKIVIFCEYHATAQTLKRGAQETDRRFESRDNSQSA